MSYLFDDFDLDIQKTMEYLESQASCTHVSCGSLMLPSQSCPTRFEFTCANFCNTAAATCASCHPPCIMR